MAPLLIIAMSVLGILLVLFTVQGCLETVWDNPLVKRVRFALIWLSFAFVIVVLGLSLYKLMEDTAFIEGCVNFINQFGKRSGG